MSSTMRRSFQQAMRSADTLWRNHRAVQGLFAVLAGVVPVRCRGDSRHASESIRTDDGQFGSCIDVSVIARVGTGVHCHADTGYSRSVSIG